MIGARKRLSRSCLGLLMLAACARDLGAADLETYVHGAQAPVAVPYKTVGAETLNLWMLPARGARPGERRPALVLIHGGAWRAGDAKVFYPHARYFAERGLVAFSIDYRLLTPTGPGIRECLEDCASALRSIRAHAGDLGVDPARVAVLGDSAGGHLAAALGTVDGFDDPHDDLRVSARPDAMVLCNPILDLTGGDWLKFVIRGAALERKPAPDDLRPTPEQYQLAQRLSPRYAVQAGQPPSLVMHGLDDRVVDPDQARSFATAMLAKGNRCDLLLIPDARHAFIIAGYTAPKAQVVQAIRSADLFLASLGYLQGPPTIEPGSDAAP